MQPPGATCARLVQKVRNLFDRLSNLQHDARVAPMGQCSRVTGSRRVWLFETFKAESCLIVWQNPQSTSNLDDSRGAKRPRGKPLATKKPGNGLKCSTCGTRLSRTATKWSVRSERLEPARTPEHTIVGKLDQTGMTPHVESRASLYPIWRR